MADPMKIRAVARDGVTEVRVQIAHDMENGQRRDDSGAIVPPWFITELTGTHAGRVVLQAQFGAAMSRNPYLAFRFRGGARGETVAVAWKDTRGETRTDAVPIT